MFSLVMPMDENRLEQFTNTKRVYDGAHYAKEIIIPTRTLGPVARYLNTHGLMKDVRLIPYKHDRGFNPAKALNIGVRAARYDLVIITSPEVKPTTPVMSQLSALGDKNVICQVFDQDPGGNLTSLVCKGYRDKTPAMYFLAMFQKDDIEAINGWDEEFMQGYAYEDNDFGERWVRAKLPFEVHDEIQATHQYHPRLETIPSGLQVNQVHFQYNQNNGVIRPAHGLVELA